MVSSTPNTVDVALNLTLAVIASSNAPLLLLDGGLAVLAASASFCRAFEINPGEVTGRQLSELGAGEWDVPQLQSLLKATASGHAKIEAYEMDLKRQGRDGHRLVLNAQKLDYDNEDQTRLILTVSDVTEARFAEKLKDDLIRKNATLLQELQHRVANSLQIIASVLLQSARRVQSDETRSHLHAAHQRVMSVAALQRQLAISSQDDVHMRPYLTELCQTIGASMIRDHGILKLEAECDDSIVRADISLSLGLVVTELVINSLKHGFPNDRGGKINVVYRSNDTDWTLSVADNGIGMPTHTDNARPGLGTSIVKAFATQLHARIEFEDADPGTIISLIHTEAAAKGDKENAMLDALAV
jgi:two-component system, sensor histidine kinase PdtaS